MDTLDGATFLKASFEVQDATTDLPQPVTVHTVTVTLNGQHGGADLIIEGIDGEGDDFKVTTVVPR